MERILSFPVLPEDDGEKIRVVLARRGISVKQMRRMKRHACGILLNGERSFVTWPVRAGDKLTVLLEDAREDSSAVKPVFGPLEIVFEDEDLFVIDKPAGMPVHPSKGHEADTLANLVAGYMQKYGNGFTFRPVNRLDKGTSGLMMVAKNAYIQEAFRKQHGKGMLKRLYLAVVCGRITPAAGVVDKPIGREEAAASIKRVICADGRPSVTCYETVAADESHTLLSVELKTGRTHQIRVHLASLGYPLVGDFLYGKERPDLICRHALHAHRLAFTHPVTGEKLKFVSPLPDDMARLTAKMVY